MELITDFLKVAKPSQDQFYFMLRADISKIAWNTHSSQGPGFRKRQYTRESKEPYRDRVAEERFVE